MKPDEDSCWEQGGNAFCTENFPDSPYCSESYNRCVECIWNENCPSDRRYCTWDKRCVECEVDAQCLGDNEFCIDDVCREKTCVDLANEGFPDYCRDRHPATPICDFDRAICVECLLASNCDENEKCVDDICIPESERDCMDMQEEGVYTWCEVFNPALPVCHTQLRECVECQFDRHCSDDLVCLSTRCIDSEIECEVDEDCMSNSWKCVRQECILKICIDYDDPDAFCDEKYSGWRCRADGVCVKCLEDEDCPGDEICDNYKCAAKTCDKYNNPDRHCQSVFGESYKCIDKKCVDTSAEEKCSDYLSTIDADNYCEEKSSEKPICDFSTGECEECVLEQHCPPGWACVDHICKECVTNDDCDRDDKCTSAYMCVPRTCSEIEYCDPDNWCVLKYGTGYACENDRCVLDDCDGADENCPLGYYCPNKTCIWGCRNDDNCQILKSHCSFETGECEECLGNGHCSAGYVCEAHICVEGADCNHDDSLCPENEYCNIDTCEEGCRDNNNCSEWTPHCSQRTGKCEECVFYTHCDPGYECDNYVCVWTGYECGSDSDCQKNWMCHELRGECIFGCHDDENCSTEKPHCSQETGECEECWSSVHCEWWQECDDFVCVARQSEEECVEGDVRHGYRCRGGVWVRVECGDSEDCLGHEICVDGMCIDSEHECEDISDCEWGYFCDVDRSRKCRKQICMSHSDCGPGLCCGQIAWSGEKGCEPCETYPCTLWDDCPPGWICDGDFCREAECITKDDCGDPNYDCEDGFCVASNCESADDPIEWCRIEKGNSYYRCLNGSCVLLSCQSYSDPDKMCMDTEGESWRCENGRCIDGGAVGTENPDEYCVTFLGVAEAFWNYDTEECDLPACDEVQDPDEFCLQVKDKRYKCRDGECRRGREGETCEVWNECMPSFSCREGICIKWECIEDRDCDEGEKCVHHICGDLAGPCESDEDCGDGYYCGPDNICVSEECDDHYDCETGKCCDEFNKCIPCGEFTCFDISECPDGWVCDPDTSKCTKAECMSHSDCESGYYCDFDDGKCKESVEIDGCLRDSDCPSGMICKGTEFLLDTSLSSGYLRKGVCVSEAEQIILIKGIMDGKTCDYCKEMMKQAQWNKGCSLPPFHNRCRCYATYED